jgi:dUTP pyrophosphatase
MNPIVRLKKIDPRAVTPAYQTGQAAGMDVAACLPMDQPELTLEPGRIALVKTGFAMAIPDGYEAQVRPRSGLSSKYGVTIPNSPGTIDSDYRGEVMVALINLGREAFTITHGMRIAQIVIAPVVRAEIEEVSALDTTTRGAGGFGSTGIA